MLAAATSSKKTLFGQPPGLTVLFLTEMWEKFSFYGMRSILVFYMTKALHFPQGRASLVYGGYTALIYLTPIAGGAIADLWLGRRRAVLTGGAIMALGHFMMAIEPLFYPALLVIAIGNGLYLPSLPSQIRDLYCAGDPRRLSAYNVYYVGINLGGLLAPLVCGTLGERFGFHYGFAAAGLGMCTGLAIYVGFGQTLPRETSPGGLPARQDRVAPMSRATLRMLFLVWVAVVIFRGAYEQMGNTVALWADENVDRAIGSFIIPASWFQALNSLLVFALTPLLIRLWARSGRQQGERAATQRMACGAFGAAGAFLFVGVVIWLAPAAGTKLSFVWLACFILLLTTAELYIRPVGLGLFGRLAPSGHEATTIAAWFLAAFAGNLLAGGLGTGWEWMRHDRFFGCMAVCAATSGVLLFALGRSAQRLEKSHA
jgi:POT family proton-dependent oligopeptide transporter